MLNKRIGPLAAVAGAVMLAAALLAGGDIAQAASPKRPSGVGGGNKGGGGASSAWLEDFSSSKLNTKFWVVASGQAPGYIAGYHIGYYDRSHVKIQSGILSTLLTQETGTVDSNTSGTISRGTLIYTRKKYGYGTYEWTMRMSSTATDPNGDGPPVSGSVSAGFIYVNNSETEIDFEFSGLDFDTLYMVNWNNPTPNSGPTLGDRDYKATALPDLTDTFHTYKFVWEPGKISYYIDEATVPAFVSTDHVPSAPAYFMINHWGTDSPDWGGAATTGTDRYFYIDRVSYTPLP
jgi:beta-glucanase (GH16 family)